ncbi:unnamed protein product [Hermetia illucens]|uniref:Uncharacterized protein n=1 Tax=Hermetia illucens TaxID=343691 RepID=A0A7R8YT70_HERIL|nr:unnamed protein product [Hermetia illucens]
MKEILTSLARLNAIRHDGDIIVLRATKSNCTYIHICGRIGSNSSCNPQEYMYMYACTRKFDCCYHASISEMRKIPERIS